MVVDDTLNHRDCSSKTDASEAADTDVYKNCANHDCLHSLLPPLVKKIIIVVISCKVRFSRCLTAKRLAITNLLQIVKAAGDAFIARAVESVKTDAGTTVDSRVNLRTSENRITVCIYDTRCRGCIGIHKVAASICRIVWSFKISITKWRFKYGKSRYGLTIALELCFTFTVCSLDSSFNLCNSLCVGLWDNQADTIFRSATVDGLRFPDVGIAPTCVRTSDSKDEQLERIREIRASERKFYQKITDLYATAIDYDKNSATTRRFYATVQNKMHYAVHGHTAAELIVERADHTREHMGLTTWADAPEGKIKKSDVTVAKNYLSQDEMKQLNRMVTAYLDFAENMTLRHIPLTMQDWEKRLNSFIEMFDYGILQDAGKVSAEIAKLHAETEFEKYRVIQDRLFMSDFDKYMLELEENAKK